MEIATLNRMTPESLFWLLLARCWWGHHPDTVDHFFVNTTNGSAATTISATGTIISGASGTASIASGWASAVAANLIETRSFSPQRP